MFFPNILTCHCWVCVVLEIDETSEFNVYKSAIQLPSVHSSRGMAFPLPKMFPEIAQVSMLAGFKTFWRHLSSEIQLNRLSQWKINVTLILPCYIWIAKFSFCAFSLCSSFFGRLIDLVLVIMFHTSCFLYSIYHLRKFFRAISVFNESLKSLFSSFCIVPCLANLCNLRFLTSISSIIIIISRWIVHMMEVITRAQDETQELLCGWILPLSSVAWACSFFSSFISSQ